MSAPRRSFPKRGARRGRHTAASCRFAPARTRPPAESPRGGSAGQSTVELVAILPLFVAVALSVGQLLAAGAAHELAGTAAESGAAAILQGLDPEKAATEALPGWSRSRVDIEVAGRRVRVHIRPTPLIPGLADLLASTATADAGPRP
jgi:hypothetical protein